MYFFVFLSGAAALVYEVVWGRQLATFLGITGYAHTVVLATFMAGLALGSRFLGAYADRQRDPLRLFGRLELGIGVFALAGLWLLPALQAGYATLARGLEPGGLAAHALRFAMAGAALLVPTFLMGGTLPALVRARAGRPGGVPLSLAKLYGANTLGAAAGAFAAGYVLLPRLGIAGTLGVAVAANFVVAGIFLRPGRSGAEAEGRAPSRKTQFRVDESGPELIKTAPTSPLQPQSSDRTPLLTILGIAGFSALAAQLAWVRALTLVLGSSVYAFSLTLAAYLAGVALGSFGYARFLAPRLGREASLRWAAGFAWLAGGATVLGLGLIGRLPEIFLAGYRAGVQESFTSLQGFALALAWSVILVPTLALGALFPLLAALAAPKRRTAGRDVGLAAAANGLGTIVGAFAAGLVLLPTTGIRGTLILAGALYVAVGVALYWMCRGMCRGMRRGRRGETGGEVAGRMPGKISRGHSGESSGRFATPAAPSGEYRSRFSRWAVAIVVIIAIAAFAGLVATLPPWDRAVMTSGPYINAARIVDVPEGETFQRWINRRNEVLFYAEGADGNVSVRDVGDERLLVINGKTDGSRTGDRKTQVVIGHLPLLMHQKPERVLVVGLGTGMTAAAVAAHPPVREIDVLELSPEVVEASRFFLAENRGVLADPRTRLIHADARNYLHTTERLYDAIVAEPSNPWISGVSNLFTREFFHLALRRLALGGVMSQWFHTYLMSDADLKTILATYESVFPYVTVWVPQVGDLVLIGSRTPHLLSLSRLAQAASEPEALAELASLVLAQPAGWARMFLFGPEDVRTFAAESPLNTDGHPRVEFNAPKNLYSETTFANMSLMVDALGDRSRAAPFAGLARPFQEEGSGGVEGLEAFGLSLAGEEASSMGGSTRAKTPEAQWLVHWTKPVAPEGSDASEIQRYAVGNRQVIRTGEAEILCGFAAGPLDRGALAGYLDGLLAGDPTETGTLALADGTEAAWILTRPPAADSAARSTAGEPVADSPEPFGPAEPPELSTASEPGVLPTAGFAWTCGDSSRGATRYAATLPGRSLEALQRLAERLRCQPRG